MVRAAIAAALLLGAGFIGNPAIPTQRLEVVVGKALGAAPASREEGRQAVDDATAAALIGAIATQFGQRRIEVELGRIDAAPAGLVQRELNGSGRVLLRASGTEPKVRVMVEGQNRAQVEVLAQRIADVVRDAATAAV